MTDDKTCATCRYSDGSTCHRLPPAMVVWPTGNRHGDYEPVKTYPFVSPKDWCGEWKLTDAKPVE